MICPECRGKGTAIYFCEIARDEKNVVVKKHEDVCHTCHGSGRKPQTNADRIRAMSDEELAEFIQHIRTNTLLAEALDVPVSREKDLEFVRQPVKDGDNDVG